MNHSLGLMIESTVAVLLMVTIGYCLVLNRRLRTLKADETALKATIAELIMATGAAERAIGTLKVTVHDCNETLVERLHAAERISADLARQLSACDDVLKRTPRLEAAPAPAPQRQPAGPTDAKAMLAAAQAFAARVSGAAA